MSTHESPTAPEHPLAAFLTEAARSADENNPGVGMVRIRTAHTTYAAHVVEVRAGACALRCLSSDREFYPYTVHLVLDDICSARYADVSELALWGTNGPV